VEGHFREIALRQKFLKMIRKNTALQWPVIFISENQPWQFTDG